MKNAVQLGPVLDNDEDFSELIFPSVFKSVINVVDLFFNYENISVKNWFFY